MRAGVVLVPRAIFSILLQRNWKSCFHLSDEPSRRRSPSRNNVENANEKFQPDLSRNTKPRKLISVLLASDRRAGTAPRGSRVDKKPDPRLATVAERERVVEATYYISVSSNSSLVQKHRNNSNELQETRTKNKPEIPRPYPENYQLFALDNIKY